MVKTINIFITVAIDYGTCKGIWFELFVPMCRCSLNGEEGKGGRGARESRRELKLGGKERCVGGGNITDPGSQAPLNPPGAVMYVQNSRNKAISGQVNTWWNDWTDITQSSRGCQVIQAHGPRRWTLTFLQGRPPAPNDEGWEGAPAG